MRIEHVVSKLSFAIEGARICCASDEVVHFVLPHIFSLHCIMFPAFVASFIEDHYMLSSVGLRPLRHTARLYHGLLATRAALSKFLQRYENNVGTEPFQMLCSLHREYHAAQLQQLFLREVFAIPMQNPKRCICVAGSFGAFVSTLSTQHPALWRPSKACFAKETRMELETLTDSKFHDYKMAADAQLKYMEARIFKTSHRDFKALAAHLQRTDTGVFTTLLKHASDNRTPGFLESFIEHGRAETPATKAMTSGKIAIPAMARLIQHCVTHPDADTGIPAITDIVCKLRGATAIANAKLFDLSLTATDYMTVAINARGKTGQVGQWPKLILKYIQSKPGYYVCAKTGKDLFLPMGYAPEKESLWTPAQSGTNNHWIDPAFGDDFDREAPFIIMFSGPDNPWDLFNE